MRANYVKEGDRMGHRDDVLMDDSFMAGINYKKSERMKRNGN